MVPLLCSSPQICSYIQDNSMDVLLNSLLDEFLTHRVVGQGWWGATVVAG